MKELETRYLERLSDLYPTIAAASTEIINLQAILNLPKGTEHFLVISGTGNLKLVNTPEVAFPKDFEVYDPKIDNKFTLTREGLSGNKVIEYLAIPRHAGNFTIPPVEFSYFDLKSNSYKTIKTEAYNLKVEKGAGNADQVIADFTNKEDLKVLGQDIRYIKNGGN